MQGIDFWEEIYTVL